jgi:hypothetical protein
LCKKKQKRDYFVKLAITKKSEKGKKRENSDSKKLDNYRAQSCQSKSTKNCLYSVEIFSCLKIKMPTNIWNWVHISDLSLLAEPKHLEDNFSDFCEKLGVFTNSLFLQNNIQN